MTKTTTKAVEARARERLVQRALGAMAALTDEERARVHREAGCCYCASVAETVVEHPVAAAGAVIGAIAGVIFGGSRKRTV